MKKFENIFEYKLIYIFEIRDEIHRGLLKIGEASANTNLPFEKLPPNCPELNAAAKKRINQYLSTAAIPFQLLHTEIAVDKNSKTFRDHDVHRVLKNSNIKPKIFPHSKAREWFKVSFQKAVAAIRAVKQGKNNLSGMNIKKIEPINFREEQEEAIQQTMKFFKKGNRMLWNSKMRFGKTLCALELVRRMNFEKTVIVTHRPVVDDGWFYDFEKIFGGIENFDYGSKQRGDNIENFLASKKNFIWFVSLQDLRGSDTVGGKFSKNAEIFSVDWDLVIVDEAHEGTQTALGDEVLKNIVKENSKKLELSGTPFNIIENYDGKIFTWDYVTEQKRKKFFAENFPELANPYEELPQMNIFTYDLGKILKDDSYIELEDKAFNFREFFRTNDNGKFLHARDIKKFLDLMITPDDDNYPFSTEEYKNYFRHTLWILPGVKEAKAFSKFLNSHEVFQNFHVVNVAGDGDSGEVSNALKLVQNAIADFPYTITLSCGRLTTGVTVPEWTAVFMLAGSFSTSATSYLQTIFRVQSPYKQNGLIKQNGYVFDFAPDRTLKVIAESVKISSRAGQTTEDDRKILGEFLNFCPVISVQGSQMKNFDTDKLLQQLKHAYADRAVKNGFDDNILYSEELFKLTDENLSDFKNLQKIISSSKSQKKSDEIVINAQGFDGEQYEITVRKKNKRQLSEEEKILQEKKSQRQKAISILRGISIRLPLLIYGADIPIDEDFKIEMFLDDEIVDKVSWQEFMPKGVTKEIFKKFIKFYDRDIFIAAGHRIRNFAKSADELKPTERVKKIAQLFSTFKNPDKETVLTPWRVVNLHLSKTFGGWDFFDELHENISDSPRFVDSNIFLKSSKILEINSKTGLYPLYAAYSIFRERINGIAENKIQLDELQRLWDETLSENIFVLCKSPMAEKISRRTLAGFRNSPVNAQYIDNLIVNLKNNPGNIIVHLTGKNFWQKGAGTLKFDAVIGNPPYQEEIGSATGQAKPIYQNFVTAAKKLNPNCISLLIPSRWFAGGMGLDNFRDEMMKDKHIEKIVDYINAKELFPTSSISGGVCYFLWNKNYNGDCKFINAINGYFDEMIRPLDEFPVLIRYNKAISIIRKIISQSEKFLPEIISPLMPFGLNTNYRGSNEKNSPDQLKLFASGENITYINRDEILSGFDYVDKFKIMLSKTSAEHAGEPDKGGKFRVLTSTMKILKPDEVCTHSYFLVGFFEERQSAENVVSYLKTKFLRFLVLMSLSSINVSKLVFNFVPLQNFSENSDINWKKKISEIDAQLYRKYKLTEEEIIFIERKVKAME